MTGSEIVEEILYKAHVMGVAEEVFKVAKEYLDKGIDQRQSYEMAFDLVLDSGISEE